MNAAGVDHWFRRKHYGYKMLEMEDAGKVKEKHSWILNNNWKQIIENLK